MKSSGVGIVAVGGTVDFALLDDPKQTTAVLVKGVEEVLAAIHASRFEDPQSCYREQLPLLATKLHDLYVSIDFLRTPKSHGVMPSNTESFQLEVATSYRTVSAFLSFSEETITFTDWSSLSRTVSQLDIAAKGFVEKFSDPSH
ncbi:hypothetical protein MRY87_07295 [bacterium]|nr:hypothetical protein [bacterium]